MHPVLLASISAGLTVGVWALYMARVPSGRVPERPYGFVAAQVAVIALAIAALALGPSAAVIALSATGLVMGALFLWLLTQRKTPIGAITVKVGDALPAFEAATDTGAAFTTQDLAGKRTLLKFFRGSW